MSAPTPEEITVGSAIGVLLALVGVLLYLRQRLRRRRKEPLGREPGPELASDRAYNRLMMARREADLLEGQGVAVARERDLLNLAQSSYAGKEYDRAYELAHRAHEGLVNARAGAAQGRTALSPSSGVVSPPSLDTDRAPVGTGSRESEPAPALAKNRAESQFQLRLVQTEIDTARRGAARPDGLRAAERLRTEAQAAFDAGSFDEAFRLALKARRQLGTPVAAVALTPAKGPAESAGAKPAVGAETAAAAERCPQCGHPNLVDDAFCRGCGRPMGSGTCPACGAPRRRADTFCGRCGQKFG